MPKEQKENKRSSTAKKLKKKKKHSIDNSNTKASESTQRKMLNQMIANFDKLFIEDKAKPTEKQLIEFSRENLLNISQSQDESKLNYKHLVCFVLKICGIEIDIGDKKESKKIASIEESSCTDFETIEDLISNSRIRGMRLKGNKMTSVVFSITEKLYNSYDIVHESDFDQLKKLIIAMLKLTQNGYRKIRYIGSVILCSIVELLYGELNSTLKIIKQKKKSSKDKKDNGDISALTLLKNKVKIFEELIQVLKEKFIQKKIADISQNIRMVICDTLIRISKKSFEVLFNDLQLIKYFPFFLNDPSPVIKIKYLQLLYDKLDSTPEDDSKTLKILINILSIARDGILHICIKEDKVLAKQGIKIIELLSQHKILEIKTVHQLLPHLFHPERQIRILISKVVKNYILIFEDSESLDEDNDNGNNNENKGNAEEKKHKKKIILTKDNVNDLIEFIHKLTDNESSMVSILIDNFFDMFSIFKEFRLFFDYIDELISSSQSELYLIHTAFQVMGLSIDKIQKRLESDMEDSYLNSLNEEYINLLIAKANSYIKKFRLPVYENIINSTQCEILNTVLELFNRLKIFKSNVITFTFEVVLDIVNELKHSFFINIATFAHHEVNTNCKEGPENDAVISTDQVLFEKICENLLKSISTIMNNEMLFSVFNYNQAKYLDEVIYSDKTSSLAKTFCDMLSKEILNQRCYKSLDNDSLELFINHANNNSKEKLYFIFTQMNYLIIFFKQIFSNSALIDFNAFTLFLLKILSLNIINSNSKDSNNDNDTDKNVVSFEFNFKFNSILLSLIETIHLFLFENELKRQEDIGKYLTIRNEIINTIFSILVIQYKEDQSPSGRKHNNYLLHLKTKAVGFFLDTLTYISSEKIKVSSMRFELTAEIVNMLIDFTKENFIDFFIEYNHWFKKDIEEGNLLETQTNFCFKKQESIFLNELTIKTFCFKLFAEKFSRLILLNFGIFKYVDMSCLYFETFFLIKHQKVIDTIITFVFESLMEKEVSHYLSNKDNNNNSNEDIIMDNSNNPKSNLTIMIFYLTKITMKVFNNKSKLLGELNNEDKLSVITRYASYYIKSLKKLKTKYNKNEVNICEKDKNFYENFLLNGMNFALEAKKEVKRDKEKNKSKIDIENVLFLDVVRYYLKMNMFLDEVDVKNMILAYLKLSKTIELTDNVNMAHIRLMERFKNYLLNKGKVVLTKVEKDDDEDNNDKTNKKVRKKKKNALEEESDDEMKDEEENTDSDKDQKNKTPIKRRRNNSKGKQGRSSSKKNNTSIKKKRPYSEIRNNSNNNSNNQKDNNNEIEEKQQTTHKKKKQKK